MHKTILYTTCIMTAFVFFLYPGVPLNAIEEKEAIEIPLIDNPPTLDGKLDDPVWKTAARF
ncbi:MAG: hypothetical protein QG657_766 [Acidobacteriota bacterium]|nr:hypothetical protein [Acidobacteriota bacterium]